METLRVLFSLRSGPRAKISTEELKFSKKIRHTEEERADDV